MHLRAISIRLFGVIGLLRKTRVAFRCGLFLVTLTVLLITFKSSIPRLTTSACVSTSSSKDTNTILMMIQNPEIDSTAYVFYHGTVSVKKKWMQGQSNDGTRTNTTAKNLPADYEALLLNLQAHCSPFLGLNKNRITTTQPDAASNRQRDLCTVGRFEPRHPCYCFSFTFTVELHFETEMISNTACQVFAFLPTMNQDSHIRRERLLMFKQGLSDTFVPGSGLRVSKDNILGYLNRFNARFVTIDVMKIELGVREWSVLKRAVSDGSLENVKQLILTIRSKSGETESDEEYRSRISTLRNLFDIGFRRWHPAHVMPYLFDGTSLSYINIMYLSSRRKSFRKPSHELSATGLTKATFTIKNSNAQLRPGSSERFTKEKASFVASKFDRTDISNGAPPSTEITLLRDATYDHLGFKKLGLQFGVQFGLYASKLENLYFDIVQQQHLFCPLSRRIGDVNDGGWDVCFTDPFDITKSKPCIAFSFGINYVWGYDDELADKYNCRVYMFDPSMKLKDHQRLSTSWFYNVGLSSNNTIESNGWKMRTLCRLFDELGHSNDTIDILKIDIEYWEWSAFETALKEGCLKRVKQLMFESHTSGMFRKESDYVKFIRILMGIFDVGFRTWKWHLNPQSVFYKSVRKTVQPCCYEHYLLNTMFTGMKTN